MRYVPLLTLPALLLVSAILITRVPGSAARNALRRIRTCPPITATVLWLALQAAVIGRLNPASRGWGRPE